MKTEVRLLNILKKDIVEHGVSSGLCSSIFKLCKRDVIDFREYQILMYILLLHRPHKENYYPHKDDEGLYWKKKLLIPRIDWINDTIEKYILDINNSIPQYNNTN